MAGFRMIRRCVACILLLWGFSACSHYRAGVDLRSEALGQPRVFVELPGNQTFLPEIQVAVLNAVRERLAASGAVSLAANNTQADWIIALELSAYDRERLASRPDDVGIAALYRGDLSVVLNLISNVDGRVLIADQTLRASVDVDATRGVSLAESQQVTVFADSIAVQVRDLVLGSW